MNASDGAEAEIATLADVVSQHAQATPNREALVFRNWRLSYAELEKELSRYVAALQSIGVSRGDRVATLSTPRPEFLLTMLAAMRLGALWIGLNPRYTLAELQYVLKHCRPNALVALAQVPGGRDLEPTLRTLSEEVEDLNCIVTIEGEAPGLSVALESFLRAGDAAPPTVSQAGPPIRRDDPAVIVYTSGSTGRPKGAVLPHASFFHSHDALAESFLGFHNYRRAHRIICNLPINHVGCQADICGNALIDGGTIIFMDEFEPDRIPAIIERERITILGGLPLMHQQVFAQPNLDSFDLSSLKAIAWGGAAMPRPFLERLAPAGYLFSMHYGLTEGGSINSVSAPGASFETLTQTVGWPDHHHRYRVVTPEGVPVGANEVGEVQMQGAGVMLGYFCDEAATRAAFTPDGWLRTGDLVVTREDGAWRFIGRMGEMYKSGGYNIYPREIELALEAHREVATAAVIGVPDRLYGEVGWAFVVPTTGSSLVAAMLQTHAATLLANFKIPKRFFILDALPKLPIGKIDKSALRDLAKAFATDAPPADSDAPRSSQCG
jgi:acyl-CoA synthetase (AMP-forming)/AMP-acid ligase II